MSATREQIAEALSRWRLAGPNMNQRDASDWADVLAPLVERIADERAAEALREARVEGYRTGVADAERGIYVPGSETLAAEREKARAPFLALADELEADAKRADDAEPVKMDDLLRMITAARVSRSAADRIRQAAEATQ